MLYFSYPSSLDHDPREHLPGHPENPERLRAIETYLAERDWLGWERREAPAATVAELELIHAPEHVERIRRLCAAGGSVIDVDTAVVPSSYAAALRAAGGACEMVRRLLGGDAEVALTAARPPGHHAEPARAMGFCLFDSIAVAAELAIRELGAERVFVVDWDVHHGNGTEAAFRERADVLFASMHQSGIFPGTGPRSETGTGPGEGYTINLPVAGGSGAETWLPLLEQQVLPVAAEFRPDLVLISAGFDAHEADPLAGCTLRTEDFATMASRTRELAATLGVPVGAVLEGGYEPAALAESVAATMEALAGRSMS
jgi:acetoin utilization deacetylase AcuC-like enzyme